MTFNSFMTSLELLFRCRWGVRADPMHAVDTRWHCSGGSLAQRGPVAVERLWRPPAVYPWWRLQVIIAVVFFWRRWGGGGGVVYVCEGEIS